MREALTGANALTRSPLPPTLAVQLKPSSEKEDDEHPEQWAWKRTEAQRELIYRRGDDEREGEDHRELVGAEPDPVAEDGVAKSANAEARAPWDRAAEQQAALAALDNNTATDEQRRFLSEEIRNQVPDVAYMKKVATGAHTVLTLIFAGNGPLGVKTLNDDLVGYQINNSLIGPPRNKAVEEAFLEEPTAGFTVTEQTYKSTTVTSDLPPQELRDAMGDVLRAIEDKVRPVYLRGLQEGLAYWAAERDRSTESPDAYEEAKRRVAKIQDAIKRVNGNDFPIDFQFGMAAIEPGAGDKPPDYAAALTARMQSSRAALMSRDPGQVRALGTDAGDRRGQIYDRDVFVRFCEEGESLRKQIIDSGNMLTHDDHQYQVFDGTQGRAFADTQTNRANRNVFRDVRKGKIEEQDLAPDERQILHLFERYFLHVNVFDNIRQFTSTEVADVGAQIQDAQRLIDRLESKNGKGKPGDAQEVARTLHTSPGMNEIVPKTETASAAVFYNAERTRTNRIIVSCDIRDMGVDLLQGYARAMHRVGSEGHDPDLVAQEAGDRMEAFRRKAIQRVRTRYGELVREAIKEIEASNRDDKHELADDLRKEREPSLLMGGDEITLSLHKEMRPYVPQLVDALLDRSAPRARVAISTTSDSTDAVGEHIRAQQRADSAHSVLKDFEAAQRDLELTRAQIRNFLGELQGAVWVRELKAQLLYAENKDQDIVLHRTDTHAGVDAGKLREDMAEVKRRLRS